MRSIVKAIVASVLLGLISFAVAKVNLFGFEAASARLSDGVYQRLTSDRYPDSAPKGQDKVRVVYLDEQTIANMQADGWTSFPPSPDQQAAFIDTLAPAIGADDQIKRPTAKVVFLDFMYFGRNLTDEQIPHSAFEPLIAAVARATKVSDWAANPQCRRSQLDKLVCIVNAGGTPVILGKPEPFGQNRFTDVQERFDEVAVLAPLVVGGDAYPLIQMDPRERPDPDSFEMSPALAIYAAYCLQTKCKDAALDELLPDSDPGRRAAQLDHLPDMSVVWGSKPSKLQDDIDDLTVGDRSHCGEGSRLWRLIDEAFLTRGPNGTACGYTVSVGYDRLIQRVARDRAILDRFLGDSLMLVGVRMTTGNDWVDNPVQGKVAGVYYHAMALDNLLERGLGGYRRTEKLFDSDMLQACLTALLSFVSLIALMVRNELKAAREARSPPERLRSRTYLMIYGLALLAWALVLLVMFQVGAALQRTVAVNWIAVTGIALSGALIAAREALKEDLGGSLKGHAVGRRVMSLGALASNALDFSRDRLALRRSVPSTRADEGQAS